MYTSPETNELMPALAKAQAEMLGAVKGTKNDFLKYKYADLTAVIKALKDPCANNDLFYTQHPLVDGNQVGVTTSVFHKSGQFITSTLLIPMAKIDPQGVGSCITYARRYSLQSIFGIANADDDAEAAQFRMADVSKQPSKDGSIPGEKELSLIANISNLIIDGDLRSAAEIWYPLPIQQKSALFRHFEEYVTEVMKSKHFTDLKGEVNGTEK